MNRYDVNCVLGRWATGGPTMESTRDLLGAMDRLGIQKALVRHSLGAGYDPACGNSLLMEQLAGNERLAPCWTLLPPVTEEQGSLDDLLEGLTKANVRAVHMAPATHGYPLTAWQCGDLLTALAVRHLVLLLEVSETRWDDLHRVCADYAGLRVIALAPGYRVLRPLYGLMQCHPNLFLDISALTNFWGIEALSARFGTDRLIFGTGQPRLDGAGAVAALNYASLKREQAQSIAAGNLERLLGEVQP